MKFWSRYFIPTLKESPAEAEIASHRLLIRAGLVRKTGGGIYDYTPERIAELQGQRARKLVAVRKALQA